MIALNMYGGSLTLISAFDSFKRVRPTLRVRVVTDHASPPRSRWSVALASTESFLANFENFLLLVLYFFIPWTAVNLVDYFIVRRGHYAIAEIFKPDGIYGRWGWRGIVSYLVGFVAMMPFFSTGTYSGWVANAAKGADFSLFIGLPGGGHPLLGAVPQHRRRGRGGAGRGAGRRARGEAMAHERRPADRSSAGARPQDATAMAAAVRDGRRPPTSWSTTALRTGSRRCDGEVNAFTVVLAERALDAGPRDADRGRRGEDACRCSAYRSRSRTTSGWPARRRPTARWRSRDFVPDVDAVPVARLRAGRGGRRRQDQQPGVLLPRLHRQRTCSA